MDITGKTYPILDLSGWMVTQYSDFLILDNSSTLLENLVTKDNKLTTISGFVEYFDIGWNIQGGEFDGNTMSIISDNALHIINTDTMEDIVVENAVWVWIDGVTKSKKENYNITLYKGYTIITNSLKDRDTPLFSQWEPVRVFNSAGTLLNITTYFSPYAPTVSLVHNGVLYLAGWPEWKEYSNNILNSKAELPWKLEENLFDLSDFYISQAYPVGDGTEITSLFTNLDTVFVWKRNGIYGMTYAYNASTVPEALFYNINAKRVSSSGVLSQSSVINVNGLVYFYDWVSVRRLDQETGLSIQDRNISRNIQNEMDCLQREQNFASMSFEYPYLKLFLSSVGKINDTVFVLNVETNGWSIQNGINTQYVWSWYSTKNARMESYFAGVDGKIYHDNVGTSYNGEPITFHWISKAYAGGD